jgi:RNA polymerase sigma-70 factor, ECF subfamily
MHPMSDLVHGSTFPMQPPPESQFAELVERAQAGDQDAFVSVVRCFEGQICGFLRKQVGNSDIADELYADMVLKAWKALPSTNEGLRDQPAMKKWLFKIAANLANDYFASCKRLRTVSLDQLEAQSGLDGSAAGKDWRAIQRLSTEGAEEIVCEKERITDEQKCLTEAMRQVPRQYRRCFYMKDVQGLSHQEIAQALNISESAARSYASRGRKAFFEALARLQDQHNL